MGGQPGPSRRSKPEQRYEITENTQIMVQPPLTRAVILENMVEVDRVFWVREGVIAPDALREMIGCAVLERYYADTPSRTRWTPSGGGGLRDARELFAPVGLRLVRETGPQLRSSVVQQAGKAVASVSAERGLVPDAAAVATAGTGGVAKSGDLVKVTLAYPRSTGEGAPHPLPGTKRVLLLGF